MKLLVALWVVSLSSSALAVSFDCTKASTFVEKTICSDPLLGKLDDALSKNYKQMLVTDFGGSVVDLRNEQRQWVSSRNKCTTRECLIVTYKKRVDETCDYGVVSGVHPDCVHAEDIDASQVTGLNGIQNSPVNAQAAAVPGTSLTSVPKALVVMSTEDAAPGEVDIPNTVDPANAEILGFHLYMTSKEVIDLIEAKYNIKPTYNDRSSCRLCFSIVSDNEYRRPFYPDDNKFLSYVSVSTPTLELKMSFTPIYPAEPNRPEVATLIEYQPHLATAADIAAFRQQVITKFGRSSAGENFWCRRGVPHVSDDKSQSYYECDAHLAKMTLDTPYNSSAILTISDNGGLYWREKKQWESEKKVVLPPL